MRVLVLALAFGCVASAASAQPIAAIHGSAADVGAIKRLVSDATDGWDAFDVERATAEYTEDAYFLNAFGRERRGRAAIKELIGRVLASPGFRAGRKGPLQITSIEFLTPTLAMVHTTQETLGQKQLSGSDLGPRRSHIFRLVWKGDGGWQTRAFIVSDERSGGTLPPEGQPARR